VSFSSLRPLLDMGRSAYPIDRQQLDRARPAHEGLPSQPQHGHGDQHTDQPGQDPPLREPGSVPTLESEDALQLTLVRLLEPETFDQRRLSRLEKLQLFVLHRTSLELRDNGEAIPLERTADVLADAAVSGLRARRRTVASSSVYDDFEFLACAQRRGERRDELARQVPITANNTQTSRRRFRFARPQTFGHRYLHSSAACDLTKFFSVVRIAVG